MAALLALWQLIVLEGKGFYIKAAMEEGILAVSNTLTFLGGFECTKH